MTLDQNKYRFFKIFLTCLATFSSVQSFASGSPAPEREMVELIHPDLSPYQPDASEVSFLSEFEGEWTYVAPAVKDDLNNKFCAPITDIASFIRIQPEAGRVQIASNVRALSGFTMNSENPVTLNDDNWTLTEGGPTPAASYDAFWHVRRLTARTHALTIQSEASSNKNVIVSSVELKFIGQQIQLRTFEPYQLYSGILFENYDWKSPLLLSSGWRSNETQSYELHCTFERK